LKKILLVVLSVISVHIVLAQDIILKKNGDEISAKVLEITLEVVKYKTHDNLEGPTISIKIADLFMIKYENGTKHVFKKGEEKKEEEESSDADYASVTYTKKGDEGATVTYSKVEYHRKVSDVGIYHALKMAPLLILNGEIPVYYERRIGDHLSIELGLGITHQDYLYQGLQEEFYSDEDRETQYGYSMALGLKFFPSKYTMAIDEMYFGPDIRYKNYNTTLIGCEGLTVGPVEETRQVIDYKLTGGFIYWVADRVMFDLYAGLGMRTKNVVEAYCEQIGPVTVNVLQSTSKETGPVVTVGFKFGFGF